MSDDKTLVRNAPARFALKNIKTGEFFEISSKASIGRQEDCTIRLNEGHVSRLHASLKMSHEKLLLKDEGSENGTFVNGVRITEVVLRPGDKVKFDTHEFTVLPVNNELAAESDKATLIQSKVDAPTQQQVDDSNATLLMPAQSVEEDDATKTLIMPAAAPAQKEVAETVIMQVDEVKQTRIQNTVVLPEEEGYFYEPEAEYDEEEATCLFGYHPLVFDKIFPLVTDVVLVGKSPQADIVLKDASVSTEHAEIFWENGYWGIEDLGSTNGTYLNGLEIMEPVILAPGDVIQFGLIQLIFAQPEPAFYQEQQSGNMKWFALVGTLLALFAILIGVFAFTD